MPYVAPSTVAAGQTYASAAHNVIVNDIIDHESRLLTVQNTQYPFRNVLINGAMQIAQRGTSVASITSGNVTYNTADRWAVGVSANGTFTNAISADAPTGSGFRNSFRMTATASAVTAAGSFVYVQQRLEGQTLQHIKKGTSSAQQLTLQFWVESNRTGTYVAELIDNNNSRSVSATYTINASDTWEFKTITFPADTSGSLTNDGNYSLAVNFWLAASTTYTSGSLATSWAATNNANRAVGQTNVAGATNGYWQVTGVQLEPGSVASPYEFVLYQDELDRCQRYFIALRNPFLCGQARSTTSAYFPFIYPKEMRSVPVVSQVGSINVIRFADTGYAATAFGYFNASKQSARLQHDIGSASLTAGDAVFTQYGSASSDNDGYNFNAEL